MYPAVAATPLAPGAKGQADRTAETPSPRHPAVVLTVGVDNLGGVITGAQRLRRQRPP